MDLLNKTKEICESYGIYPSRSKGQNFLISSMAYDRIVEAAELTKDDTVLEVGPGLGFLTSRLAKNANRVLAVEMDDKLAAYLRNALIASDIKNVEVINEDVLKLNLNDAKYKIPSAKYKIVANLPYNITSFFLRTIFSSWPRPSEMVLLLQKEVVERICAKPGDMSLLALSIQFYAEPQKLFDVPRKDFWPSPQVDSAVIKIKTKGQDNFNGSGLEKRFFQLAKIGFSAKRKMLKNNLAGGLKIGAAEAEKYLAAIGLDAKARAEDLAVDDWIRLISNLPGQ